MCMAFLLALFGCREKHLLDGPGMINTLTWESFELSRSDSYYCHNFWFTLKLDNGYYLLTGECAEEDGNTYKSYDGIKLTNEEADALRRFDLDALPDEVQTEVDEELLLLDAPSVKLTLVYADGSQKEKRISESTSLEIYEVLLPYFINN